jgi:hypothetical protein
MYIPTRAPRSITYQALASCLLIAAVLSSLLLSYTSGAAAGHHVTKHSVPGFPSTVSNALVYNFYWSLHWNTDSPNVTQSQIDGATTRLLRSTFLAGSHQYGANSAVLDGSYQDFHNTFNCKPRYTESTSQAGIVGYLLCNMSNSHHLPKPDGHKIYVLYLPPKTVIGDRGCNSALGYHSFVPYLTGTALYIVIPLKCNPTLGAIQDTLSHEVVETMTDPVGAGWYEGPPLSISHFLPKGEVGDICDSDNVKPNYLDGLELDAYWSNADNACVATNLGALIVQSFNVSITANVATATAIVKNNGSSPFTKSALSLGIPARLGRINTQGFPAQPNLSIPAGGTVTYSAKDQIPLTVKGGTTCYVMDVGRTIGLTTTWSDLAGLHSTSGVCLTLDANHHLTQSPWHAPGSTGTLKKEHP